MYNIGMQSMRARRRVIRRFLGINDNDPNFGRFGVPVLSKEEGDKLTSARDFNPTLWLFANGSWANRMTVGGKRGKKGVFSKDFTSKMDDASFVDKNTRGFDFIPRKR